MRYSRIYSLIFFVLFVTEILYCDVKPLETGRNYKHHNTTMYLEIGYPFVINSTEFFETYSEFLKGTNNHLSLTTDVGMGIKISFFENFRFGVNISYLNAKFSDTYKEKMNNGIEEINRDIIQNFDFNSIPIIFTADMIPTEKQFRTYAGLMAGAVVGKYNWKEDLTSNVKFDIRKGGNHFKKNVISPAIGIYTGIDLGFDKNAGSMFLGSFFIETSYLLFLNSINIFENVSEQFRENGNILKNNYNPFPGCLSLKIGVSFNLGSLSRL
jgi:hypothetical protein